MFKVANKLLKLECSSLNTIIRSLRLVKTVEIGETLEKKLAALNASDPSVDFKVDIGLPPPPPLTKKEQKARKDYFNTRRKDPKLEYESRKLLLNPDLDDIREEYNKSLGPHHLVTIADHYNIFNDLFGDAYFVPYVALNIFHPLEGRDLAAPVCRGNVVKPSEAFAQPTVRFESKPDELWTLTFVSPDGHLTEDNMEYVHWFVGNIPGGDVSKGETIWDYLPPFPPRGVGFQRFVYILYKQDRKINYSKLKQDLPCLELKNRSFKTLEFYRERQDDMTPAGLAFFQSDWDKTSQKIYHEILNMEEPVFEYDFPPKEYNYQKWFPKKQPFDLYLDRYRDPKDIAQEYIEKILKETHPFKPPQKLYPYPKAARKDLKGLPSWLIVKELRYRMRRGRVTEIERHEYL